MQVTECPIQLASLVFARKARIVAIDGAHGSGKSTLARTLQSEMGASLIEVDQFLKRHQDAYLPNLDYRAIASKVDPECLCILEGICIRQVLAVAGVKADVTVYVKRMERWGWADEDYLVAGGPVEAHLERLKMQAAPFCAPGAQPQPGLWDEVIRYHATYCPQDTSDFIFLRSDL